MPPKSPKKRPRESFGAIRALPSGRYQASYTGPDGTRYPAPRTFETRTDARAWLAAQRVKLDGDEWEPPTRRTTTEKRVTVAEYAERWIDTRTGRDGAPLRPRTADEYRRLAKGPIGTLADEPVALLKPAIVREWYSALVATGRLTQAARAYGLLRAVLETATEDGLLKSNPAAIRGAMSASTGKEVRPPTREELDTIVAALPERFRSLALVAAWGGLRFGEATELRRADVLEVGDDVVLSVTRAVVHTTSGGFVVGPPKSKAGVRAVTLPRIAADAVRARLEVVDAAPDALLWPGTGGGHLAASTLEKSWSPARHAAGRPDLPWHGLRHFGATQYAIAGATIRELQGRLGHSSARAAMRYQAESGRDAEITRRMG